MTRTVLRGARWPGDVAYADGVITAVGRIDSEPGDVDLDVSGDLITTGLVNTALHRALRAVESLEGLAPPQLHRAASSVGVKLLQREQRTRPALTVEERSLLLPHYHADLEILEEETGRSFAHWRDPENSRTRRALEIDGRFGTGFTSIDRPGGR